MAAQAPPLHGALNSVHRFLAGTYLLSWL